MSGKKIVFVELVRNGCNGPTEYLLVKDGVRKGPRFLDTVSGNFRAHCSEVVPGTNPPQLVLIETVARVRSYSEATGVLNRINKRKQKFEY